ncbi:competence/damage-inducible protein A [Alkalibacillus salilacus]|uniref:Putative competence-damage inducible protein n=1 Tax=Alkalibacillus salilacus TaxID=284582 RepID=A0ABT9VDH9_9BACI|nr:competence/damage-inducible protein A [Alkalibacillus salilacus]MDQ0159026.1 nicotinamide-nucleotide amidase [Alkalibacillus salilacus]
MTLRCEVISVGTELLLGQIVDTNASWLSKKLNDVGLNVLHHQTVGDNANRMKAVFQQAQNRSDLVIVTGGLGPTEDDLTREVAAELFDTSLLMDKQVMNQIEQFFGDRNISMTENNRKQALHFNGGQTFENYVGMAPGLAFKHQGVYWFFLPGVPKEMKDIMSNGIIPYLHQLGLTDGKLYYRTLYFQGIGESILETELLDLIQSQTNPTIAPLAGDGYVMVRLAAKANRKDEAADWFDELEELIRFRVGEYIVNQPRSKTEQVIEHFKDQKISLASCESLTGGLFSSTIVDHAGVSSFYYGSLITYNNQAKHVVADVPANILDEEGAVSHACAKAMASGAANKLNTDVAISFTGVAGPNDEDAISPGTVYIGLSVYGNVYSKLFQFTGSREDVRQAATDAGMKYLYDQFVRQ